MSQGGDRPELLDFWMWESGCLHGLDLDVTSTGPRKKYLDLDFWMSDLDFWMSGGPKSGCLDFLDLDVAVPGPRKNIWMWANIQKKHPDPEK